MQDVSVPLQLFVAQDKNKIRESPDNFLLSKEKQNDKLDPFIKRRVQIRSNELCETVIKSRIVQNNLFLG